MARTEEKKLPLQKPSKVKEMRKDRDAPVGLRSAYQIFLKMECDRLKKIHGESSGGLIRDMAIKAWGLLSNKDRQVYIHFTFFTFTALCHTPLIKYENPKV